MSSKYFKGYADGHNGEEGHFYCEVVDELIVKQVFVFGDDMYWATEDSENNEQYFYTDQPEFPDSDLSRLKSEFGVEEISSTEFFEIWKSSQKLKYD